MLESMQILQILREAYEYLWVFDALILSSCWYFNTKGTMSRSDAISFTAVVVIGGISYRYGLAIFQATPGVELTSLQSWLELHPQVRMFAWYLGFYVFALTGVVTIYQLHKSFDLSNGYLTTTILFAYMCDGMINLCRLAERYLWNTDYLDPLYQWGIPSINIGVLLMAAVITAIAGYKYFTDKKQAFQG